VGAWIRTQADSTILTRNEKWVAKRRAEGTAVCACKYVCVRTNY
jgi:hypothetical protein